MASTSSTCIGSIRPEEELHTPIMWSDLTPEKKKVLGAMIDMYLDWARSVPEIMEMVEDAKIKR